MKIIAHRGAANYAAENSRKAISIGANSGALYVEFDIHKTSDNILVVNHDKTINGMLIKDYNYSQLIKVRPLLLTLQEALKSCYGSAALIDIKPTGDTKQLLLPFLNQYPNSAVTSFDLSQIKYIKQKSPTTICFLMQHNHPFGLLSKAKAISADGIGINKYWLFLLPFVYHKAKRLNLELYVYTVNNILLARMASKIAPKIFICTDKPIDIK